MDEEALVAVPVDADTIRDELRAHLANILYLEVDEIDGDATFTDLGLDSVLGVELVSLINSTYGLDERLDTMHEHATLNQLTSYVHARIAAGETSRT